MRSVTADINVIAVKSIEDILEGKNGFNVIELADNTLNLFTLD
jgi:hypothetical protein